MVKNKKNCIKFLFVGLFLIFIENSFCKDNTTDENNKISISENFLEKMSQKYIEEQEKNREFISKFFEKIKSEYNNSKEENKKIELEYLMVECVRGIRNNNDRQCAAFVVKNALLPQEEQEKNKKALNEALAEMNTYSEMTKEYPQSTVNNDAQNK